MLGATWGVGEVLWSIVWFTLFFIWIWLLIGVFADIFRSHDMSGVAKFLWVAFVIVTPYLGVFVYLIARGNKMGQHALDDAQRADAANRAYIRDAVGSSGGPAEEIAHLADLRTQGAIDDAEFQRLKAEVVGA
jgi:phospholipase D-like protein